MLFAYDELSPKKDMRYCRTHLNFHLIVLTFLPYHVPFDGKCFLSFITSSAKYLTVMPRNRPQISLFAFSVMFA